MECGSIDSRRDLVYLCSQIEVSDHPSVILSVVPVLELQLIDANLNGNEKIYARMWWP